MLPLIPDLAVAAGLGYLRSSGLLRYFDLYLPDLAWVARISGSLAASRAIIRTALTTSFLRKNHLDVRDKMV